MPEEQLDPASFGVVIQPRTGSQSAVRQVSLVRQLTALPLEQIPALQVLPVVQALPSSHDSPSGLSGLLHVPVVGSQVPATWHWSEAVHVLGLTPAQVPPWQ